VQSRKAGIPAHWTQSGAFSSPPQPFREHFRRRFFDVTVNGVAYQEMHVDGGAFAQAFLYPAAVTRERRAPAWRGGRIVTPARAM
jgi:hypothetical protein